MKVVIGTPIGLLMGEKKKNYEKTASPWAALTTKLSPLGQSCRHGLHLRVSWRHVQHNYHLCQLMLGIFPLPCRIISVLERAWQHDGEKSLKQRILKIWVDKYGKWRKMITVVSFAFSLLKESIKLSNVNSKFFL